MIKSKAPVSTEELGEQYFLVGPYNESCVRTEVELLEPSHYAIKGVLEEMRSHGIKVLFCAFFFIYLKKCFYNNRDYNHFYNTCTYYVY